MMTFGPSIDLAAESKWLYVTMRRVCGILRAHAAHRYIGFHRLSERKVDELRTVRIGVAKADPLAVFVAAAPEPIFGYSPDFAFGVSLGSHGTRRKLPTALAPYFGVPAEIDYRAARWTPRFNCLAFERHPDGETLLVVRTEYAVQPSVPAPALFVTDIAYFFDAVARVLAGQRPTRVRQYGSKRGPRPTAIAGRGGVLSKHTCPRCGHRLGLMR